MDQQLLDEQQTELTGVSTEGSPGGIVSGDAMGFLAHNL